MYTDIYRIVCLHYCYTIFIIIEIVRFELSISSIAEIVGTYAITWNYRVIMNAIGSPM